MDTAAAAAEESSCTAMATAMIDEKYEFLAPKWFDFVKGETEDEMRNAELWFESALSYGPSPFMPRIKARRSFKIESLCNFNEAADQMQKAAAESLDSMTANVTSQIEPSCAETKEDLVPREVKEENKESVVNPVSSDNASCDMEKGAVVHSQDNGSAATECASTDEKSILTDIKENIPPMGTEVCTPKLAMTSNKGGIVDSKKLQTAKKIASMLRNPSTLKPKNQLQSSEAKGIKPASAKRETNVKNTAGTSNLTQENQAIKRQKLDGGRSRQILNVKPPNLPHKTKQGLLNSNINLCPSTVKKNHKENRKVYVREPAAPFVSMAEMMKKFQSSTRDLSLPRANNSLSQDVAACLVQKKLLTLTRPKEPEFETSQRIRPVRVKSSAELEEEMMAKIPKFKARPLNKKILEAPTLPALPKSIPQPPEFQEFQLKTMERANQHTETSSVASTEASRKHNEWRPHLTDPKSPVLQTMLRARPAKVKSSLEIEQEELERAPKFKARPLNKKIFESKGELGIFCNTKKHITIPQEFHFATNERIPPTSAVVDLFDKLSLNSEPHHDNQPPRNTAPNPFHLRTEERGAEKEKKFVMEVIHKQLEEERARVPKANPYPYTTDYPVIPPKPEPKQCTKPEPFQLESLVRHEEEMQKEMEERMRMEREKAQRRIFKAQPILREDPIPVPEKVRKPLTEIQGFNLHIEHRAVERAEFDQRIKEKEMMYKRYREESEAARTLEEEKALKQMRRTMVPHARPVPNFNNPFCPQKSTKETTKPKSPKLRVLRRKETRKTLQMR